MGRIKTKAVVYRRVSSESQARPTDKREGGWSLQSQETRAQEYAKQHDLKIVEVFEEVASASKPGRPVFGRLLDYLERNRDTVLIVEKMDRLGRNGRDTGMIDQMVDEGLTIHLVAEKRILGPHSSPGDRLTSAIEGVVAEWQRRLLAREVIKGQDKRAEEGFFPNGNPPYGYCYPPRRANEKTNIVPVPKESAIIVKMFEAYTSGEGMGFRQLAALADKLGYRRRKGSKGMAISTSRGIIMNPVYAGWVRHNGEIRKGKHEAIIPQTLFDAAQERIAQRPRYGRRPNRAPNNLTHAFSGIFLCAHCGATIRRHEGRKLKKLGGARRGYWECRAWCEHAKNIQEADLYDLVRESLDQLHLPRKRVGKILASMRKERNADDLAKLVRAEKAVIQKEQRRRRNLNEMLSVEDIDRAEYLRLKQESEQTEAAARERIQQMEFAANDQAGDCIALHLRLCDEIGQTFANGTPKQQRRLLGLLWETNGTRKSTLDCEKRCIKPAWRPIWKVLLDAKTGMVESKASLIKEASLVLAAGGGKEIESLLSG